MPGGVGERDHRAWLTWLRRPRGPHGPASWSPRGAPGGSRWSLRTENQEAQGLRAGEDGGLVPEGSICPFCLFVPSGAQGWGEDPTLAGTILALKC